MQFLLVALILAGAYARPMEITPERAPGLADQVQVQLLGRVVSVRANGQLLRLKVGKMAFTVETQGRMAGTPVHAGERVLVTGELLPGGRIRLRTLESVTTREDKTELIGMLISVDLRSRRLTLRSDAGRRVRVPYSRETTFVRLGRRSSAERLRFGERLWIELNGNTHALRVEVIGAGGRRFVDVGRITSVDAGRAQLQVRFGGRTRTVIASRADVSIHGKEGALKALRAGQRVRVHGIDRRGMIAARRIESLP